MENELTQDQIEEIAFEVDEEMPAHGAFCLGVLLGRAMIKPDLMPKQAVINIAKRAADQNEVSDLLQLLQSPLAKP